jgi:hypothetical protein
LQPNLADIDPSFMICQFDVEEKLDTEKTFMILVQLHDGAVEDKKLKHLAVANFSIVGYAAVLLGVNLPQFKAFYDKGSQNDQIALIKATRNCFVLAIQHSMIAVAKFLWQQAKQFQLQDHLIELCRVFKLTDNFILSLLVDFVNRMQQSRVGKSALPQKAPAPALSIFSDPLKSEPPLNFYVDWVPIKN